MITKSRRSILPFVSAARIVAAMLLGGAVSTAFAAPSLTPLGDLLGGLGSWVWGVSADGSVVVGSTRTPEAFRWTSDGGMVGLGDLPGGEFSSYAWGVSGNGSVVVGSSYRSTGFEAFRWTAAGGMQGLGYLPGVVYLPGGHVYSQANGASADGSVVVGWSDSASDFSNPLEAFRWTTGAGMVGLGDLPGGSFHSAASGVNGDGSVIVGYSYSASGREAMRWTAGGGMIGLGDLPGGGFYSEANGVSGDGSVIVGIGSSADGYEAFRTSGGGMVGLGDLPGGSFFSTARGVNGDGSVIVGYGTSASGEEAFRWTADGGMRALWDVLLSYGVDPAADGWTRLVSANGISADGNTIAGSGTRNGNPEAFVAVIPTIVPEPAAGALALLPLAAAALLRRRR